MIGGAAGVLDVEASDSAMYSGVGRVTTNGPVLDECDVVDRDIDELSDLSERYEEVFSERSAVPASNEAPVAAGPVE